MTEVLAAGGESNRATQGRTDTRGPDSSEQDTDEELADYWVNERINDRGVLVDVPLAVSPDAVFSRSRRRVEIGDRLLLVTPGIRPLENREEQDQKRVMSPEQAFRAGADYIVVGRPVRAAPGHCGGRSASSTGGPR